MIDQLEISQLELSKGDDLMERLNLVQERFNAVDEKMTQLKAENADIDRWKKFRDFLEQMKSDLDGVIEEGAPSDEAFVLEARLDNVLDEVFDKINDLEKK